MPRRKCSNALAMAGVGVCRAPAGQRHTISGVGERDHARRARNARSKPPHRDQVAGERSVRTPVPRLGSSNTCSARSLGASRARCRTGWRRPRDRRWRSALPWMKRSAIEAAESGHGQIGERHQRENESARDEQRRAGRGRPTTRRQAASGRCRSRSTRRRSKPTAVRWRRARARRAAATASGRWRSCSRRGSRPHTTAQAPVVS